MIMISSGDLIVLVATVVLVVALFFTVRHYVMHAESVDGPDSNHHDGR
jgi:hypothetical protein